MGTLNLATSRYVRNPVRVQRFNASLRAGDDFRLILTVYDDDNGTPAALAGARGRLALYRDEPVDGYGYERDYGLGWHTLQYQPELLVEGVYSSAAPSQMVFAMGPDVTVKLYGRYRIALQINNYDGLYTQIEGVLQLRLGLGAGLPGDLVPFTGPVISISDAVLTWDEDVVPVISISNAVITDGWGGGGSGPFVLFDLYALAFDPVDVGASGDSLSVLITNTGDEPLVISDISVVGDFEIVEITVP